MVESHGSATKQLIILLQIYTQSSKFIALFIIVVVAVVVVCC